MNESNPLIGQLAGQLTQIGLDDLPGHVNKRVETENKVDRPVGDHLEAASIVRVIEQLRVIGETAAADFDAALVGIDDVEALAMFSQIMGPAPKAWTELENRAGRQVVPDPRPDRSTPLRRRSTPRRRPFFAAFLPFVTGFLRFDVATLTRGRRIPNRVTP